MKKINLIVIVFFCFSSHIHSQNFEWARGIGGMGQDEGFSIAVDISGNVYTTGYFSDTVDFDPGIGIFNLISMGNSDIFISKLDSAGNFIWAKNIGGTSTDRGVSLILGDTNLYVTGTFNGTVDFNQNVGAYNITSIGGRDVFILKLDTAGDFIWAKNIAGTNDIYVASIDIDEMENLYATGYFSGAYDFDTGPSLYNLTSTGTYDIFIFKLDNSGNLIWAKQCGKEGYHNGGASIKINTNHDVYITGYFDRTIDFNPGVGVFELTSTSTGSEDVFILKLDSLGDFTWVKQLGGIQTDHVLSMAVDNFGGIYTTGFFRGTTDFDPGVGTYNLTSASGFDIFISKINADGNFVWAKNIGGTGFWNQGNSLGLDANGNVFISGEFEGIVDFDSGVGTYNLIASGQSDVFISKLDSSGTFLFARNLGGIESDVGNCLFVDTDENIYLVGSFTGIADFNPNVNTFNLTATGLRDVFVVKLSQNINTTITEVETNTLLLFPNPTFNELTLYFKEPIEKATIKVSNVLGEIVRTFQTSNSRNIIELGNSNGIYFVQVEINGVSSVYKILKQ